MFTSQPTPPHHHPRVPSVPITLSHPNISGPVPSVVSVPIPEPLLPCHTPNVPGPYLWSMSLSPTHPVLPFPLTLDGGGSILWSALVSGVGDGVSLATSEGLLYQFFRSYFVMRNCLKACSSFLLGSLSLVGFQPPSQIFLATCREQASAKIGRAATYISWYLVYPFIARKRPWFNQDGSSWEEPLFLHLT